MAHPALPKPVFEVKLCPGMKRLSLFVRVLVAAGFLVENLLGGTRAHAQTPPSADEVIRKVVERAEGAEALASRPDYTYRKHTITLEIDAKGQLKDRREKLYEVTMQSGFSSLKLLQVNGQKLSLKELKKQEDHDAAERAKLLDAKPNAKGDKWESFVTADLVARYKFNLVETKTVNGRLNHLISFEPKSASLPMRKLTDRFLNHVTGRVWIDAQDFEITKAEIRLNTEITLWGGVLGTLRRCDYTLVRTRLPDGVWFNSFSHGVFEGRKLLETMLVRTMSESTGFRKLTLVE